MSDPEYSAHALFRKKWSAQIDYGRFLRAAGASPETIDKVTQLYAESHLLNLDYRAMLGDDGAQQAKAAALRQKQQDDLEAETQAILGEEKYALFHSLYDRNEITYPRVYFSGLANRLSYTPTPLSSEKIDALYALFQQHSAPKSFDRAILSDPFIEDARAVLSPDQHTALRQLQAEQRAKEKRAKLPKSSEIPRL